MLLVFGIREKPNDINNLTNERMFVVGINSGQVYIWGYEIGHIA